MAPSKARKSDDAPAPPAVVQPRRYKPPAGWKVGEAAPEDRYVALDHTGAQVGKPSKTPPSGMGRMVVAKGDVVTEAMRRSLGLDD